MATYVQLESEVWWRQEYEPPALRAFNDSLRAFYGMGRSEIGSKGDNNHTRGRHRSMAWSLNSVYCTDRSYGTRDSRDKTGDPNALRASDVGITGETLYAASARLDKAVRAGLLPCVAEWFGTVDGKNVIGWYEGKPSTSDDSHLYHLHVGIWTSYTTNAEQLKRLAAVIKGEDDMAGFEDTPHWKALNERVYAVFSGDTSDWKKADGTEVHEGNPLWDKLRAMEKRLDELEAGGGTAGPSAQEIAKAVNDDAAARLQA